MNSLAAHIIVYLMVLAFFIAIIVRDSLKHRGLTFLGFLLCIGLVIFTLIYGGIFWW